MLYRINRIRVLFLSPFWGDLGKGFCFVFVLLSLYSKSQNLVPNPSFEILTQCPTLFNQIYYAPPWFQPCIHSGNTTNSSSSDVYDTCSNYAEYGVPTNVAGFQYAQTGFAYAAIYLYGDTVNYREYLEVPLTDTLIANKKYCVEFYVSLSYPASAVSNCGAYFSNDSILDTTNLKAIDYITPQIENPIGNMLNDTANWMLISGNFIAQGGERFMTIGNFHNPANTNVQSLGGGTVAYYYVDDVSVVDCTGIGISEVAEENTVNIFPNPATNSLTLTLSKGEGTASIYNVLGQVVYTAKITNSKTAIDISTYPKGVYFININNATQSINRKFVKE